MSLDQPLIVELAQWFDTPPGQYVRQWEQRQVDGMVANVFGYHAIQVGMPHWDLLSSNRMPHKGRTHLLDAPDNAANGVCIAAGQVPQTAFLGGALELDDHGYIVVEGASTRTNVPGVFAAGDCADPVYQQAISAA